MKLREITLNWLKANCLMPPAVARCTELVDHAIANRVGCCFVLGKTLTKSGVPFMVELYCGEMFVFQLSGEQAAKLGTPKNVITRFMRTPQNHEDRPVPPIRIDNIQLANSGTLKWTDSISGTLSYSCEQSWTIPISLQIQVAAPDQNRIVTGFHQIRYGLHPPGGTIPFEVSAPQQANASTTRHLETVRALFFQLNTEVKNKPISIEQHLAQMFDFGIPPSPESPVKLPTGAHGIPYEPPKVPQFPTLPPFNPFPNPIPMSEGPSFRLLSDIRAVLVDIE